MIDRRVALLRGINVGTANRIAMADLRDVFANLGYRDVRTLLNSGNVIYTVEKRGERDDLDRIERAIAEQCGVKTRVTVLNGKEVAAAVKENPLTSVADNPSKLLVMVLRDPKATAQVRPLVKERWAPEALVLGSRVVYLWCAGGIVNSPVWAAVARAVGDAGTARNIATMTKLLALVDGS